VGSVTETPGPVPEPTNADLLAFMQTAFAQLTTEIAGVKADFGGFRDDMAEVKAGIEQLRGDAAELKVEFALLEARVDDAHRAILRHGNDPNAHPNAA